MTVMDDLTEFESVQKLNRTINATGAQARRIEKLAEELELNYQETACRIIECGLDQMEFWSELKQQNQRDCEPSKEK